MRLSQSSEESAPPCSAHLFVPYQHQHCRDIFVCFLGGREGVNVKSGLKRWKTGEKVTILKVTTPRKLQQYRFHLDSYPPVWDQKTPIILRVWKPQVTCHVGVPSCGQSHRNAFTYLISHLYYHPQRIPSPRLHTPHLGPFLFFPTHPLLHMTTFGTSYHPNTTR